MRTCLSFAITASVFAIASSIVSSTAAMQLLARSGVGSPDGSVSRA